MSKPTPSPTSSAAASVPAASGAVPAKPGRLLSLDAFRGMTIAAMILVNNAGDWGHVFAPLNHAEWHGCTATDLIFPFFLFIVGVSMTFSFARRMGQDGAFEELVPQIYRRTILLLALGLGLQLIIFKAAPWVEHYRFAGVLQRIALCYFFTAFIMLGSSWREQAAWAVGLLLLYYALMKFVPVPGYGAGVLDMNGNLASWLDNFVFGQRCYHFDEKTGMGHDPEGLLSTLPAISTTLSGVLAGHWLRRRDTDGNEKVAGLATAGFFLLVLGALWRYDFPYNKNLWTSSYVLHTSGWAMLTLGVCYWIIDVKGYKAWSKPFVVYGTNAIAAYVGASAMAYTTIWIHWKSGDKVVFLKTWVYTHGFRSWIEPLEGPYVSSAAYGTAYVLIWLGLMTILYRKKIFIKV